MVEINNLNFVNIHTGEAAMGGRYTAYVVYGTLYNGICYEIALAVGGQGPGAGSNDGMGPLPKDYASPESKKIFTSIFDQVLSTFKFIEPEVSSSP